MANALYPKFKESLLDKLHDLNSDSIVAMLCNSSYSYSSAHTTANTSNVAASIANSSAFTNPTIALGVFDANDFAWSAVGAGPNGVSIILFNDNANKLIIAFYDSVTGLPVTPNGGNINLTVHASGWFAL